MIHIARGSLDLRVTRGAFENYYQHQGFRALEDPDNSDDYNPQGEGGYTNSGSPTPPGDLSRESILGMNTKQLMELADTLGLGSRRVRTKGELQDLILRTRK